MLSDSLFEIIYNLLESITQYDYSKDYEYKLIRGIMELQEIQYSLDQNKELSREESIKKAYELYERAIKKRDDNSIEYFQ